jgi:hypothetical protein
MAEEGGGGLGQTGPNQGLGGATTGGPESEVTVWRGRALQAEEKIGQLEADLLNLRTELEGARKTLDAMVRRREVEQQLIDAKAQDVETALLLVEQTLAKGPETDVGRVVAEVKHRKPHLFEPRSVPRPIAAGAAAEPTYQNAVGEAFEKARAAGGGRRTLMEYLRVKRKK